MIVAEAEKPTIALAKYKKPAYMRLAREAVPIISTKDTPFETAKLMYDEVHEVATGTMTYHALVASEILYKEGIEAEVIHCPTVKPLDAITIKSVKRQGCAITVEEHQITEVAVGAFNQKSLNLNQNICLFQNSEQSQKISKHDRFGIVKSGKPEVIRTSWINRKTYWCTSRYRQTYQRQEYNIEMYINLGIIVQMRRRCSLTE